MYNSSCLPCLATPILFTLQMVPVRAGLVTHGRRGRKGVSFPSVVSFNVLQIHNTSILKCLMKSSVPCTSTLFFCKIVHGKLQKELSIPRCTFQKMYEQNLETAE